VSTPRPATDVSNHVGFIVVFSVAISAFLAGCAVVSGSRPAIAATAVFAVAILLLAITSVHDDEVQKNHLRRQLDKACDTESRLHTEIANLKAKSSHYRGGDVVDERPT
jgi:hypothetical protein